MKEVGTPIAALTAYDYPTALALRAADIDICLVGDSLANVALGFSTTQMLLLSALLHHAQAVQRTLRASTLLATGGPDVPLVVADMPFGTFQTSLEEGVRAAVRLIQEGGVDGVKIEGLFRSPWKLSNEQETAASEQYSTPRTPLGKLHHNVAKLELTFLPKQIQEAGKTDLSPLPPQDRYLPRSASLPTAYGQRDGALRLIYDKLVPVLDMKKLGPVVKKLAKPTTLTVGSESVELTEDLFKVGLRTITVREFTPTSSSLTSTLPYAYTTEFASLSKGTMILRERETTSQRIGSINDVIQVIVDLCDGRRNWTSACEGDWQGRGFSSEE
ncbi:unnamed protein product [Tilletia controversa]|nr:unnamed protein product [Tilletia controversa]